jgi:hypothetical protein
MKIQTALAVLALLFSGTWTHAQEFSLSTPVDSDDQVLNSGTAVFAVDFSGMAETVNGVDFISSADESDFSAPGFTGTMSNDEGASLQISTYFDNVLSVSAVGSHFFGEILLGNLTEGQTYFLQVFAGGAGDAGDSETLTDGSSTGDLAFGGSGSGVESLVETFVAGSSQETISFSPDNYGSLVLDAVNLREEAADPAVVPEPSVSELLLAGAFLVLGAAGCRRGGHIFPLAR